MPHETRRHPSMWAAASRWCMPPTRSRPSSSSQCRGV